MKKTYGALLKTMETAFNKKEPLLSLPSYRPDDFRKIKKEKDDLESGRQRQVVSLIRTQFLKRFESSAQAFFASCNRLLAKLFAWMERHADIINKRTHFERWKKQNFEVLRKIVGVIDDHADGEEDAETPELYDMVKILDPEVYNLDGMYAETLLNMDELARFIEQ